jgi:hypothetical protein
VPQSATEVISIPDDRLRGPAVLLGPSFLAVEPQTHSRVAMQHPASSNDVVNRPSEA